MSNTLNELTRALAPLAQQNDHTGDWPIESLDVLTRHGCWRWMIPAEFGGDGLNPTQLIQGYEAIARGCMNTTLIFTQHDAAVDLIVTGDNEEMKERLCPRLATGELLLTVGISQLTTSRQGGEPAMRATWDSQRTRFTGEMPWATSAAKVDAFVTGGVMDDGRQILACVRADTPGITAGPPMNVAALQATWTTAVRCDNVVAETADIIRGPIKRVLAIRGTVRPMVVSATGVGLAGAMLDLIRDIAPKRSPELRSFADRISHHYDRVRRDLYAAADALSDPLADTPSSVIRASVNDLLVRLATVTVTIAKGSGYLKTHPAQRLAREALFFLVWSAPDSVQVQTLEHLLV